MLDLTTFKPGTQNEPLALLASENENRVFSVEVCIAERQSPEYHTLFNSTHKTVRLTTYPMHFSLHKNSLFNVTTLLVSLLPSVESTKSSTLATQAVSSVNRIDDAIEGNLGYRPTFWGRDNEKGLYLDLQMHPASLTLYSNTGPFIRAEFLGIQASVTLQRLRMDLELIIQGYLISDLNPVTNYPKLLYKMDPNVPFLQVKMNVFKEATLKDKYLDLQQKDLYVEVKLARIRLILLADLIAKVVPFFTQLAQIDFTQNTLIDSAKDAAAVTAKETAAAAKSSSSNRIGLNILIEAPSVLIPLDCKSKDVFILDVGNFKALNSFHFASDIYGSPEDIDDRWKTHDGDPAVVDKMKVTFSDLQINRCQAYQEYEINVVDANQKFAILQPVNVDLFLDRSLNECQVNIPKNKLSIKIDIISLHIKPQDLVNLAYIWQSLGLIQASLEISNARKQVNSQRSVEVRKSPTHQEEHAKATKEETSTNIFVATAILETVKITVYSEEDSFADIFLTHLKVESEVKPPVTKLHAVIHGFGVRDLTPNSIYPEILSTSSTTLNLIELNFESRQDATKGENFFNPANSDGRLTLTIGKIKFYLIYSFMNHILHTLLQFKVSRKTVEALKKQAKKQAATTATSTVDIMKQSDTKRFIFAVKVEAPVIIVPVSSESNEGLVLDLGLVTVNNAFSIEKPNVSTNKEYSFPLDISNQKVIFDKIDLTISSIQLYRQVSQNIIPTQSDPILQSFELGLSLIRTIPFNKNDNPQALIYLSLSPILMEFHLADYKTILNIIQSNLKSGMVLSLPIDESDADSIDEPEPETPVDTTQPEQSKLPIIALYIHLDGYTLAVIARDQEISTLMLKSFDIEVKSTESMLSVTGEVGELKLTQPQSTHYSNIISLAPSSEQFIRFSLIFKPNLAHDPTLPSFNTEYDIDLNVEVGEVEVIILYGYISKMVNFATNFSPKNSPKSEEIELSEETHEIPPDERFLNSIASLDKFSTMKQRLKVNINLKAPVIYIPQNSVANQVIVARLGNIMLKTEPVVKTLPDTKEQILSDNYQLTLSKLTISRGFINNANNLESRISMRPLTSRFCLEVSLIRRITPSVHLPFLLVHLHLHEISLLLGSLDLEMITNVIIDQIKDQDTSLKSNETDFSFSLPLSPINKPESSIRRRQTRRLTRQGSMIKPHIFTSNPETSLLSVNLQIDSIGLKLFHKERNIPDNLQKIGDGNLNEFPIPEENSLAYLAIVNASLVGEIKASLMVEVDLILNDIVLQDNRIENVDSISRMISRSILEKDDHPLFAVHLKRLSSDDLTIRVFLCNLTAIFSTEFLITIALFFWDPIQKVTQVKGEGIQQEKRRKKKKEPPRNIPADVQNKIPTFRLNLAVKNPTVLLLENTADKNPRTLVGKLELSGIIKHDQGVGFSSSFTLSNAQLYTCLYNSISNPYSYVIAPLGMHMNMKGLGEEIHVVMESIAINLTPSTLALVSSIAESLKFPDKNDLGYAPVDLWGERDTERYAWFLRSSESIDSWSVVLENTEDSSVQQLNKESLDVEIRNIDLKLDSEFRGKITPIMLIHASAEAVIQNWSTQVEMEASFTTEASYFNEKLSVWEPLLEPAKSRSTHNLVPFRFRAELNRSEKGSTSDVVIISDSDIQTQAIQAEYALEVRALDGINLCVSRELIEILTKYKQEFDLVKGKVKHWEDTKTIIDTPANAIFVIQNELTIPINIALDENDSLLFDPIEKSKAKTLIDNTPCHVYSANTIDVMTQAVLSKRGKVKQHYMHLSIENFNTISFVPIHRTGNLLYILPPTKEYFVVVEINLIRGCKQVIIRSPMKIRNELEIPMELFASTIGIETREYEPLGVIQPKQTFYVSLHHTFSSKFSLAPHALIYNPSQLHFGSHTKFYTQTTHCSVQGVASRDDPPFSFTLEVSEDHYTREPLKFKRSADGNYPHHIFTAHVPSILHNLLPIPLNYEVEDSKFKSCVQPGSTSNILFYSRDDSPPVILTVTLYGIVFRGKFTHLSDNNTTSCKIHSPDNKLSFVLGIHAESTGSLQIKVFAAYWVINKTSLNLQYKSSESGFNEPLNHESTDGPLLFPSTNLGSKVKLAIRRSMFDGGSSEWSNSVAIGAVGSENLVESVIVGSVESYQFGIKITTSSSSLTKIVIITPYNLLINNTKQEIQIQQKLWDSILLKPGDCTAFYPTEDKCKIVPDTSTEGAVLNFAIPGQILLQFDGSNPAIAVDISTNVSSNVITFQSYYNGAVPLQIVNSLSEVLIEFRQGGCIGGSTRISPGMFTHLS